MLRRHLNGGLTPPARRRIFGVSMLLALLAGCSRNYYELELRPAGEKLERKLTCWQEGGEQAPNEKNAVGKISAEELSRIDALYEKRLSPPEAARQVFWGEFGEKMPADLGGSGTYTQIVSPLGVSYAYAERFRGSADIDGAIVARRLAADRVVDFLLGWFESEWGDEPGFADLRRFMHQDFRKDLKNVGLHLWLSQVAANYHEQTGPEFALRACQLLLDRGYLRLADAPELARMAQQKDLSRAGAFVARFLARKMGVPDDSPLPEKLELLLEPALVQLSLERYLRTTTEFEERQAAWEQERERNPDSPQPQPLDVLGESLSAGLVDLKLLSHPDSLRVRLLCGTQPFETNGQWEEAATAVDWKGNADRTDPWTPFCYALWSVPDEEQQIQRFGQVVLSGRPLAEYALWHAGLDESERAEWEKFVAGLQPGNELENRIRSFAFAQDAAAGDRPSLAETPQRLLLNGLSQPASQKPGKEK